MKNKLVSTLMPLTLILSTLMITVPIIPISASPGSIIYWVDAGAVGDGTSETTPAGNITYVLTTYALSTGDVIKVKPGTYDIAAGETFPITLCVSGITLESTDGAETTIIDAGGSDICIKIAADTVTVSGFTVKNAKGGINFDSSVNKCTINGNIICDISDDGIRIFGASNNKIVNNKILNIADLGIYLTTGANNTISANNISTGGFAAVELWGARELAKNNMFENNVIENNNIGIILFGGSENKIIGNVIKDSTKYHGIHLQDTYGNIIENNTITSNAEQGIRFVGASNNKILRNIIQSNKIGLYLKDYAYGNSTGNKIHYNNILDNSKCGINNTAAETVDARFNWWGNLSGPNHSTNPSGTGDKISDCVDYSPWLGDPFEITPRTYHVNPTGTIQEAIDEASPGDTIIVHDGTYNENIVVNKALTIQGVNKETTIVHGGGYNPTIQITANDVVINGFTVEQEKGLFGILTSTSITQDNIVLFDNIFDSRVQLYSVDNAEVFNNKFKVGSFSLWRSVGGGIYNNTISTFGVGIALYWCNETIIEDNEIFAPTKQPTQTRGFTLNTARDSLSEATLYQTSQLDRKNTITTAQKEPQYIC